MKWGSWIHFCSKLMPKFWKNVWKWWSLFWIGFLDMLIFGHFVRVLIFRAHLRSNNLFAPGLFIEELSTAFGWIVSVTPQLSNYYNNSGIIFSFRAIYFLKFYRPVLVRKMLETYSWVYFLKISFSCAINRKTSLFIC